MARKFKRNYRLIVDTVNQQFDQNQIEVIPTLDPVRSVLIEPPFTVEFDIHRDSQAQQNFADITVHNLGPKTRRRIYKDYALPDLFQGMEFWAGYGDAISTSGGQAADSQIFPLLFRGNIQRAYSEGDGSRMMTHIEAQSGSYAAQVAVTSRTYAAGTPVRQIIIELISDMPAVRLGAVGAFEGVLERGNTFSGSPEKSIRALISREGGSFFIDNERAFCLLPGEVIPGTVPIIRAEIGLMGTPRRENHYVTAKMVFAPDILVGQRVELYSTRAPDYNGEYKVTGISHQGTISENVSGQVITTVHMSNLTSVLTEVLAP